jgi:hypothetical protein
VDTTDRTAVYSLLNPALGRASRVVDLGDAVIVQAEYLGNDAGAEPAPYACILVDEYLACQTDPPLSLVTRAPPGAPQTKRIPDKREKSIGAYPRIQCQVTV